MYHGCAHDREGDSDSMAADHTLLTMDDHPAVSRELSPFESVGAPCC